MPYNEKLNDRIREVMASLPNVREKYMFGGTCFMLNEKMCIGVIKDEMMCRIGPEVYEEALERYGCREMAFTGKAVNGYVFVSQDGIRTQKDFDYWMGLCITYNPKAKASKKKLTKNTP